MIDFETEIRAAWDQNKGSLKAKAEAAGLSSDQMATLPTIFAITYRGAYEHRFALPACSVRAKTAVESRINDLKPQEKLSF